MTAAITMRVQNAYVHGCHMIFGTLVRLVCPGMSNGCSF